MKGLFEEVTPLYLSPNVDLQALSEVAAKYGDHRYWPPSGGIIQTCQKDVQHEYIRAA